MNRTNQPETSTLVSGAAYIRYSSEMQSDSFSLDAPLRQIKEQAEHDGVEIVKVYAVRPNLPAARWVCPIQKRLLW
jgi:predicted xylose isomerase-like sugar epimerase